MNEFPKIIQRAHYAALYLAAASVFLVWLPAQTFAKPKLTEQLGCGNCHLGVKPRSYLKEGVASLEEMASRLRPAYIQQVLSGVIELKGMPRTPLNAQEALGVVKAIYQGAASVDSPWPVADDQAVSAARARVFESLDCGTCHGEKSTRAKAWSHFADRYRYDYVKAQLGTLGQTGSVCTTRHKALDANQQSLILKALAPTQQPTATDWASVKAEPTWLVAAQCHQCHATPSPRVLDLSLTASRVKSGWLAKYVAKSTPLRPSGVWPGDGRRMPHYDLSETQARQVTRELKGLARKQRKANVKPSITPNRSKGVARLLKQRYSCQGCHRLGGQGGRVGPALDQVGLRLTSGTLAQIVQGKDRLNPWSMAAHGQLGPHAGAASDLVAFLDALRSPKQSTDYLDYMTLKPKRMPTDTERTGALLYQQNCASCHGSDGRGQGFNARFLERAPMVHRQQAQLARSTDERLHMGLSVGGWVLGKSRLMPGFGGVLSRTDISALVQHLRTLCQCEPPGWSKDATP